MPREEPGLVLDVVPIRDVGDVVQQRRRAEHAALIDRDGVAAGWIARGVLVARVQQAVAHVKRPDRVLEPRVHRAWIDKGGAA